VHHALELYRGRECVFVSDSRWIYPLFEAADFLRSADLVPKEVQARDRVVGRAAALVHVYLAVGSVHAGLLSRGGRSVLEAHRVPVIFDRVVDRVGCQTEEILADVLDPERAWRLLRQRAGLEGEKSSSGTGTSAGRGGRRTWGS